MGQNNRKKLIFENKKTNWISVNCYGNLFVFSFFKKDAESIKSQKTRTKLLI